MNNKQKNYQELVARLLSGLDTGKDNCPEKIEAAVAILSLIDENSRLERELIDNNIKKIQQDVMTIKLLANSYN